MKITLKNMLAYLADCQSLSATELQAYGVDIKSKEEVLDTIKAYNWLDDFNEYTSN